MSKPREFWIFDESSELKTVEQQGQCGEMYVIEKSAYLKAVEALNEITSDVKDVDCALCFNGLNKALKTLRELGEINEQ